MKTVRFFRFAIRALTFVALMWLTVLAMKVALAVCALSPAWHVGYCR